MQHPCKFVERPATVQVHVQWYVSAVLDFSIAEQNKAKKGLRQAYATVGACIWGHRRVQLQPQRRVRGQKALIVSQSSMSLRGQGLCDCSVLARVPLLSGSSPWA
jgi:hypothetical protein